MTQYFTDCEVITSPAAVVGRMNLSLHAQGLANRKSQI